MDLTESYRTHFPAAVLERYEFRETRNAAAILHATNPAELGEIIGVLDGLRLDPEDVTGAGANKSHLAARIDGQLRTLGWREGRHDTRVMSGCV